jgi:hypothetical protein
MSHCDSCRWFHSHAEVGPELADRGECHRYPPTPLPDTRGVAVYQARPVVWKSDGCGEYKAPYHPGDWAGPG